MRASLRSFANTHPPIAALIALLLSCSSSSTTEPNPGSIQVSVETTGEDIDSDGYTVTVSGHPSQSLSPNGSVIVNGVSPGTYSVQLSDVADNCQVAGDPSQSAVVQSNQTSQVGYSVTCEATTGNLTVTTVTNGDSPDPDGYEVTVDESLTQSSGTSGNITFSGLSEGSHSVELSGLAENCAVSGPNPRNVTITAGGTAQTTFTVECSALTGELTVSVETTGSDQDADGYTVTVDGEIPTAIDSNGTVVFDAVAAGSRSVELTGIADNCTVSGTNPKAVDVPEGGSVIAEFSVACGAVTGSLEVQIETDGEDLDSDGYSVLLDGGSAKASSVRDTIRYENLAPGDYSVELTGIADNCSVTGSNPRTVTVSAGTTETTAFTVTCSSTTGGLRVGASTTGEEIDSDGYVASVDGGARTTRIGANGDTGFGGLSVGDHQVALEDVAENCEVFGDNPRTVTVTGGGTVSTTFNVECNPTKGEIRVRVNTSGQDQDPNGYVAEIDGGIRTTRLDPNDETGFGGLAAGDHEVELTDVASNCSVLGANPRTISAVAGETVLTTFGIECEGADLIAFASNRTGNYEIFAINPEGGDPVNLSNDPADDFQPQWSPDGTRIAFSSERDGNREIYLVEYPTLDVVRLTHDPSADFSPVWSPDGQKIAFVRRPDGDNDFPYSGQDIFVINRDGSGLVNVSDDSEMTWSPSWSPDSRQLAYVNYGSGTPVFVTSVDGSETIQIAQTGPDYYATMVAWSPSGDRITFFDEGSGLRWANPTGTEYGDYDLYLRPEAHAWSNSGTRIAYYGSGDPSELHVMNADGSNRLQVTDFGDSFGAHVPSWSPDGQELVFEAFGDIFTTSISSRGQVNVTNAPATNDIDPDWRP